MANKIDKYFTEETYTVYAAIRVINEVLEEAGIKPVNSGMIYQYTSNGRIPTINNHTGRGRKVRKADLIVWLTGYIVKKTLTK